VAVSKLSPLPLATSVGPNTTLIGFDPLVPSTDQRYTPGQIARGIVIASASAPSNPQPGQLWYNPVTQLVSIAEIPPYTWSDQLSAGAVVVSGGGFTAARINSSYPNIIPPAAEAGARSTSLLPAAQKYVFAITTNMDLSGSSGFGIADAHETLGNGMFIGDVNPSHSIGYYVESLAFYYFNNNSSPLAGASPIGNGLHYVAIDPVARLIWVKPTGGNWNANAVNNPATGVGGVFFSAAIDLTTTRIIAQFFVNGDQATIDPAAAGLSVPAGFTPLSQIVQWVPLTYVNPSAISGGWVNIKDFGAIGDGVGEDGAAFQAFTAAYQGKNVVLYIPPGTYQSGSNTLGLWRGIKQLTIIGYGASISAGLTGFGGVDDKYGLANSALVASANAGDVQLTLVSIGDASKFNAGDWLLLGALDVQGGGIPPNPHFMEFVQVTSITGSTVFLDYPLRGGPYLSTYPYYTSNAFGVNEGGPATIYNMTQMLPSWDADIFVYGLTFLGSSDMPFVRNKSYKDCQWPGLQSSNWPPNISQAKSITFDNCLIQGGGDIEVDKCVERLTFRNCNIAGYFNTLLFQSSSIQQLVIDGCNILTLNGTPRNTYITNSWIGTLTPGPRSNGIMESLSMENSFIGSLSSSGWASAFGGAESISAYTFANGTFSRANAATVIPWACPGAKCVFEDASGLFRSPPSFTVLGVRGDGGAAGTGNVHIDTTLTTVPVWTQGTAPNAIFLPTLLDYHPYGRVTIRNCRGDRYVMNWQENSNAARDAGTGFQYAHMLLTGDSSGSPASNNMHAEGTITSININVLRAYTGANGNEHLSIDQFQTYDLAFAGTIGPTFLVNAKTAGVRSWSAGVWTGGVAGDTLPALVNGSWLWGYLKVYFDNSMAGDTVAQTPIVIVEIITDVGIIKYPLVEYNNALLSS
jgi:Pectate lyase superfamily protein